jgi:hypothetical protein
MDSGRPEPVERRGPLRPAPLPLRRAVRALNSGSARTPELSNRPSVLDPRPSDLLQRLRARLPHASAIDPILKLFRFRGRGIERERALDLGARRWRILELEIRLR